MQGQANHFSRYAPEKIKYGIERYIKETDRLYSVLEDRLAGKRENPEKGQAQPRDYLVGAGKGKYSVADMNCFPWVRYHFWAGVTNKDMEKFPNLKKWLQRIGERDAVKAGIAVPEKSSIDDKSEEELEQAAKEASAWIMKGNK